MADRWGYGIPSSGYSFPNLPATSETWSGLGSSSGGAGSTSSNQHQRPAGYGMDRGTSPYACSECGYSFYTCTTEDITRHMLSHINSRQSPATSSPTIGQSSVHSMYAGMQSPVTTSASNGVSSMNSLNSYPYSHPNAFPSAYPLSAFPGQQRPSSSTFPGQEQLSQSAFPGHDRLSQRAFPGQDRSAQSAFPGYDRPSPSTFPGQERSPPSAFPGQERSPPSVFPGQERSPPSAFPGQERSSQSALLGKEPPSQSAIPAQNQPSQSIFPGQSPPQSVFPGQPPTAFPGQIPSHYNHPKPPPLKPAPHIQQQLANRQKELDNRSIIESIYSYPIPKSNETIPVKENKLPPKPKESNDNSKSIEDDLIPKPKESDKKTETIPEQKNSETKPEKTISVIKPSLSSILGIGPRTVQAKVSEEKSEKNEILEKIETSTSEKNGDLKQQKRVDIDESSTSNSSEKDENFSVPPKKMKPDPDFANSKTFVLPTLGPTLIDEDKIDELKKVVVTPLKSLTRELTTEEILQEKEKEKEKGSNEVKITPFAHMNKDKVKREKSAVLNFFPNKSKKKAIPKAPPKAKPKPKKTNFIPKITSPTPISERGSRRAKSEVNYAELDDPYNFMKNPSTPKPQPQPQPPPPQPPIANQVIKDIGTKNIKSPEAKIIKSPVAKIIKSPVHKRGWTKSKGYADYGPVGPDVPDKVKSEPSDESDSENGDGETENANGESGEANGETKVENKVKLDAVVNQFSDHPLFSILGGEEEWSEQVGETAEPEQDDHIDLSNFLSTDMPDGVINPNGPRHKAPAVFTSNPTEWGYPEKPQKDYAGKRYQCDYCDYGSSELTNIKTHIRGHTGEKPYKCSVCNFRSSRSNSIKMHMRTHTGEKPFKCDLCGKAFTKSSNLIVHRKTHTGEKDYKCALCGDAFITPGELKKHIRCHTGEKPYQCKHCEQCFSDSSTLQRHTKTHTGEKPYECDICGKTFTRGDTLTHHRRTHTGEKPYKCSLCPKAYIQSCRLKQHMMKDHFAHLQQQALNETQDTIARAMGEQGGGMANAEADLELLAEKETQEIMSAAMKTYDPTAGQKAVYTCTLCPKSYIQSCRLKSHFLKDHLDYLQQQAEDVIEEAMRKGREREEGLKEDTMEERKAETKSEETDDTESHLEELALQATENLIANAMQTDFYETDGIESQMKTENNTDDGAQIPSESQMETDNNIDDGSQIKTESTEATHNSETNNAE